MAGWRRPVAEGCRSTAVGGTGPTEVGAPPEAQVPGLRVGSTGRECSRRWPVRTPVTPSTSRAGRRPDRAGRRPDRRSKEKGTPGRAGRGADGVGTPAGMRAAPRLGCGSACSGRWRSAGVVGLVPLRGRGSGRCSGCCCPSTTGPSRWRAWWTGCGGRIRRRRRRRRCRATSPGCAGCSSRTARRRGGASWSPRRPGTACGSTSAALDAALFEQIVEQARPALAAGAPELALARLRRALGLWRGEAYEDLGDAEFAVRRAGPAGRAAAGRHRRPPRCRARARPCPGPGRRAAAAGGRAPVAGAVLGPADGRALRVGAAGGGAGRLPLAPGPGSWTRSVSSPARSCGRWRRPSSRSGPAGCARTPCARRACRPGWARTRTRWSAGTRS